MMSKGFQTWVPWGMAAGRAALGPVLIAGAACGWNPLALAGIVVAALVSDIFDGVLARRWGTDTAGVRLFDSMADTVFYLCAAVALWMVRPEVLRANGALLGVVLGLEAVRFAFDLAKFGKAASYHSYLAKAWGLVMALAVTAVFAGRANALIPAALWLGISCNVEGLAMSMMLPAWRRDLKWVWVAWRIRVEQGAKVGPIAPTAAVARKGFAAVVMALAMLLIAVPAFAMNVGETAYKGGTIASVAADTVGTLDTAAAETLVFRSRPSGMAAIERIDIAYAEISNFQYSTEVAHHIGVMPAIVVGMVKKRERKHFFTITYTDSAKGTQVAIFKVSKEQPKVLLAILRARAPQACGKVGLNYCGGTLQH